MPTPDEAVEIIEGDAPGNTGYLEDLVGDLKGPSGIALVPFVGAGFSKAVGFPTWREFLELLAGRCAGP